MNEDRDAYDGLIQFLYQAPIGLMRTQIDGEITMINPMAASLLMPLARDGDLGNLFELMSPFAPELRAQAAAHHGIGEAVGNRVLRIPVAVGTLTGTAPQTLGLRLVLLDEQTWMATVSDITQAVNDEQRQIRARLHAMSRSDGLTGLPNRDVAVESIQRACAGLSGPRDAPAAILFINLDRFARINTVRGQLAGDHLLRLTGERLARIVQAGHASGDFGDQALMAARLGADEFVIVAQRLSSVRAAADLATRVVDTLGAPYRIDGQDEHASASVGLMVVSGEAENPSPDALLLDAGIAMSVAKRAGGGGYRRFDPDMKARAARHATIETDLRGAIGRGELSVAFQPIVALDDRQCVGMEALVRWQHPSLGNVPPMEFVGVAEESGLIRDIGLFVLTEACRACVGWKQQFGERAPSTMSVNVSRAQLTDPDFAVHVQDVLGRSGMHAADLQLEVTESLAAQDDTVQRALHELKALGIVIALDDFGTGYSSLASLHLLPIDVLKIDRSFVSQLESSMHHRVLVQAVILVARSLGMGTVAEGIETQAQAEELARLTCDKGQGYLFARPLAQTAVTRWLSDYPLPSVPALHTS